MVKQTHCKIIGHYCWLKKLIYFYPTQWPTKINSDWWTFPKHPQSQKNKNPDDLIGAKTKYEIAAFWNFFIYWVDRYGLTEISLGDSDINPTKSNLKKSIWDLLKQSQQELSGVCFKNSSSWLKPFHNSGFDTLTL